MRDLVNRGLVLLNEQDDDAANLPRERTIIVTGVARGGTSMLAQVLERLGLFLGELDDWVVLEDPEILRALQNCEMSRLTDIIANRNQRFEKWGFKVPNLHIYLPATDHVRFRNAHYVVIFRDPLAIAKRNELSMRENPATAIREAGENVMKLTQYVCSLDAPILLISYEKALQNGKLVIEALSKFCGLTPNDEQIAAALATINPNGYDYILATQDTQPLCRGVIDKIKENVLEGWCCYRDSTDAVEIEVCISGGVIGRFSANDYREDLARAGVGLGYHAFNIDVSPFNVDSSSVISVRPVRDALFLPNSGRTVAELRERSRL